MIYDMNRTLVDAHGNVYTMKEAVEKTGIPYGTVYDYVVRGKCDSIAALYKERLARESKTGWANTVVKPPHKTKFGYLTARQIWEKHPYKDTVSLSMLSNRLHTHGGMSPKIWEDRKHV